MRIVYFYQYFTTPKGSYGTRVYEFTRRWAAQGHDVTVVTSVYYKSDLRATKLVEDQEIDGVKLKVLNVQISNKQSSLKRVWTFVLFAVLSSWFALTLKADVVIASSGPLTIGIPGLVARYLRGRRFVFEVRDLWPDVPIELGLLRNPVAQFGARVLERRCYRAADAIVALSPGMAEHIRSRHAVDRVVCVPNAADNDLWTAVDPGWQLPTWAEGRKLALYSGNIGHINNSELLFEAAIELKRLGREDIIIMLVGDGQLRGNLTQRCEEMGLSTFRILGLMPKTELRHWVQRSLCSVVPLQSAPILDTSSPNKLFDSLAAGVPVIQTTNGWIKDFLTRHGCGITVSPTDAKELAGALVSLADSQELWSSMGENAKKAAKTEFDRDRLSALMLEAVLAAGEGRDVAVRQVGATAEAS